MNVSIGRLRMKNDGFTLVEVLIVIVIIGILAGIAIPAITNAIATGKTTKMRMEISALEQAIERYRDKYGDYPPDFSNWTVVERHYRKAFPRIAPAELNLLQRLLDDDTSNDTTIGATPSTHNAALMDRGEALVWTLGGYSKNPINPFTGPGGPLELISSSATNAVYQINVDRPEKLYDFDPARLDYSDISSDTAVSATNRYVSADGDLFPYYSAGDDGAPFVYFDSRTYAYFDPTLGFNGYGPTGNGNFGFVRPYYSTLQNANTSGANYGTLSAALGAWQFIKPDTFQIIAPGLDGQFGSFAAIEVDGSSGGQEPLYFQYPSGLAIAPISSAATPGNLIVPGIRGFQESSKFGIVDDFQLDNVSSFSRAKLIDDLEE